ncbi:adenylate/guanylate cyclase domain-containing protein [Agrobacterium radiobacter]
MSLLTDLQNHAATTFQSAWEIRDGRVVPAPTDLKLTNDTVVFERATVLYADLTASTLMVNTLGWQKAAEIYKTFLFCAAKIIRNEGGAITSYDGDRVMGIFIGDYQSTSAAKCGLKINWAVQNIINPALNGQYTSNKFTVQQIVGIDTSKIYAARTGVRGDNDIVWVGRAANYAAKLTELKSAERTWITADVYNKLAEEAKFGGTPRREIWSLFSWKQQNDLPVYGSTWNWSL